MEKRVTLWKKIKASKVLAGFPGFGLVSTISTGFVIDHLNCEQIGKYCFEEGSPTLAIHGCRLVDPIGIYYSKKYNLVIVHSIAPITGMEWKAAEIVLDIAKQTGAKEIITTEGVGSKEIDNTRGFFYSTHNQQKKQFENIGINCLGEGIIVGVTSAILMRAPPEGFITTAIF